MYNYHLWIVLAESSVEYDEGTLAENVVQLKTLIRTSGLYVVPQDPVYEINTQTVLQFSGSRNHRGDNHNRLMSIIEWIAGELPGSHGLVYWSDDENPGSQYFDGYNVLVLARGMVAPRFDPFLSPLTPVVED